MKKAIIDPKTCTACDPCVIEEMCENRAVIRESKEEKPWVDSYKCAGCMRCATRCPFRAIGQIVSPCGGPGHANR